MVQIYAERRKYLAATIKKLYPHGGGIIVLFSAYEQHRTRFWQDSTFWYFTGIDEPGVVCIIDLDGCSTLYIPQFIGNRAIWVDDVVTCGDASARDLCFDAVVPLGEPVPGYSAAIPSSLKPHAYVLEKIRAAVKNHQKIYMCASEKLEQFAVQRAGMSFWLTGIPTLFENIVDVTMLVARMRRTKSTHELLLLQSAVAITEHAQRRASRVVAPEVSESVIHAELEYEWIARGARAAFPAIVGSGYRSTVLHYDCNDAIMRNGDLVVVDCGAAVEGYCADISRTYPVSGEFSSRQRELYERVTCVYEYIAAHAQPGLWLFNEAEKSRSLYHMAVAEFKRYGLDHFFLHGIGHFLGLDVHDVGDRSEPLQEGDVFTIEPGLYLREEQVGVRIEDDFVITSSGARCLGTNLPIDSYRVEQMMRDIL